MAGVRDLGLRAARHLDSDIWEVRADGNRVIYRVLFAEEGARGRILLALEGIKKKTQDATGDDRSCQAAPCGLATQKPMTSTCPEQDLTLTDGLYLY